MFYKRSAGAVMNIAFRIILAGILLFSCIWLKEPVFAGTVPDLPAEVRDDQIPVLSLQIEEDEFRKVIESEDHSYRAKGGTISITVPEGYCGEYSEEALKDQQDLELSYIRGRGNSTWQYPKKPFRFKLKESTDLLGMGADKHWVLLANILDGSMLKNRLTSFMGKELGLKFTPLFVPVDLVVNGEYMGSYVLGQQIRIGKSRVNIVPLDPEDLDDPEITGGYLLRMGPKDNVPEGTIISTNKGVRFQAYDPGFAASDPEDDLGAPEQKAYLTDYLQNLEDAIYAEDFQDQNGVSYTEYMDISSAARYWLIQEFVMNGDAFWTDSTYLYKDRGGKLCWGPLWDFDLAFPEHDPADDGGSTEGFSKTDMPWLDHLRDKDPVYQEELKKAWQQLDPVITAITQKGGVLDLYAAELEGSWEANLELTKAKGWLPDDEYPESLGKEIEKLRTFLTERQQWFNDHIDSELSKVFCEITFEADGEIVGNAQIRYQADLYDIEIPDLAAVGKEGSVAAAWIGPDGKTLDPGKKVFDDMAFTAELIPEEEAVYADGLYFGSDEIWFDPDTQGPAYQIHYTTTPENANVNYVRWTSSDPDIAEVKTDGMVILGDIGDVEITGELPSGAKASFVMHILGE